MSSCIANGCDRDSVARGMCKKHWARWRKGQDINEKTSREKSLSERLYGKADVRGESDCWEWKGPCRGRGDLMYGMLSVDGVNVSAHRLSYQISKGDIADGLCVLHKCDNPKCINPNHLFLGTHKDNSDDKIEKGRDIGSKTHCKRGHEFTDANTYFWKGKARHCRKCHAIGESKRRERLNSVGG